MRRIRGSPICEAQMVPMKDWTARTNGGIGYDGTSALSLRCAREKMKGLYVLPRLSVLIKVFFIFFIWLL